MKVIYNDKVVDECKISPLCNGFTYGEGFFTTIKVVNKRAENINYHYKRIEESLEFFGFKKIEVNIDKVISLLDLRKDFRLKIIIFKDLEKISYIAIPGDIPKPVESMELKASDYIRGNDPIHSYKSLNYYNNLVNSFTIFRDHRNRLLETGIGNIFVIKGKEIITPFGDLPILNGTYRNYLLDKETVGDFYINQGEIYYEDLKKCDGVFITNALRGVVPVSRIDNISIKTDVVKQLQNLLK